MKLKYNLLILGIMSILASCQKPEYILPTVERQSITSISAFFTSGPYDGLLLARLEVTDPDADEFVIPVPFYYPEESDDLTTFYMTNVRIKAELADDCKIDPPLSVLNLNDDNHFTFTDASGNSRPITIRGKRVKSSNAELRSFVLDNPPIEGFIDNEEHVIYLFTTDDLSSCSAEATFSNHAEMKKTDLSKRRNYNDPQEIILTAPNGNDIVYRTEKAIPSKIAHGFNKESVRQLFNFEPTSRIGTPGYTEAVNPSLASVGGYLVLCMGDGSTPVYLDGQTGSKKGQINLGSAQAGSIASDEGGNMLICNHISVDPYTGKLEIYKTRSVSETPVLFYEFETEKALPRGGKIEISGNVDTEAMITILFEGISGITASQEFISIKVSGGSVVSADIVSAAPAGVQWGAVPTNSCALVPASADGTGGWFYATYGDGSCALDWIRADATMGSALTTSNGNSWAWNPNQLDCKNYNNAQYLALLVLSHFPAWGVGPQLYIYDVTDRSSFKGEFDSEDLYVLNAGDIEWFQMTNATDTMSSGDVLIVPSADGYKVFIYYFDQYSGVIGGYVADCIKKGR